MQSQEALLQESGNVPSVPLGKRMADRVQSDSTAHGLHRMSVSVGGLLGWLKNRTDVPQAEVLRGA